jgi:penicillin-binding protein 2
MNITTVFDRQVKKIVFIFLLLMSSIACRLFYLQIYLNNVFFSRAQKNFTRTSRIPPTRGNILDCHGNILATNRAVLNVYWRGMGTQKLTDQHRQIIHIIETIANTTFDNAMITSIAHAEKRGKKTIILNDIPLETLSKIIEKFPDHENIRIKQYTKRHYPQKEIASHIVGYIGTINVGLSGKMGIEKLFESSLHGEQGQTIAMINSMGTPLYKQTIKQALSGNDITTTLDISLQKLAEMSFDRDKTGALILMDPENGAIKALVSRPSFDPGIFLDPICHQDWLLLQEKQPFLNRAFNACYPPGSIFKLITISAALEHGIIDLHHQVDCKGYTTFHGRRFRCSERMGHGTLSIRKAVAKSCNILFYNIGKVISMHDLADYASRFGLGQKTNIIFAEKEGLIPSPTWKLQTKGEPWWTGETLLSTIGQSYLLVTPIQIACMISSIFKGYLVRPRILEHESIQLKPLMISHETRNFLKKAMKSVITEGTAQSINKLKNIKIYGKTSTAEICKIHKKFDGEQHREHGWFAAYFSDKNSKPLVLVVLLENAGTSRFATSIAKRFLMQYRPTNQA